MSEIKLKNKYFSRNKIFSVISILCLGILSFVVAIDPDVIDPTNIAWMASGDPLQHYLGWVFFRDAPWTFPVGLNPRYGLEISNSIVYSDSNPLLAIILKPFSRFLPATFQYFGLWLLVCFCLQAWFSVKLIGLFTKSVIFQMLGACLFLFSPAFIVRMGGHDCLAGHFLILAALFLALDSGSERRSLAWGLLLVISSMVHPYLLAMNGLIWTADIIDKTFRNKLSVKSSLTEGVILFLLLTVVCWQIGYFSVMSGVAGEGFGFFRMNILSVFNPAMGVGGVRWSYLLPELTVGPGDYEGFNYPGLGVIFLVAASIPVLVVSRIKVKQLILRYPGLLAALICLLLFALSNQIGFGVHTLHYPVRSIFWQIASVFRASGRMFWPVYYTIYMLAVFLVVKGYRRRFALMFLAIAVVLQLADTSAGYLQKRNTMKNSKALSLSNSLADPFWEKAAKRYRQIRYIPVRSPSKPWQIIGFYGATYGLATDAVYLARIDSDQVENAQHAEEMLLKTLNFSNDTLYVMDDASFNKIRPFMNSKQDLVETIDGFNIVAPGWKINT